MALPKSLLEEILDKLLEYNAKSWGSYFELDPELFLDDLIKSGAVAKHCIKRLDIYKAFDELATKGLIDYDEVVNMQFINSLRKSTNVPLVETNEKYALYRNTQWLLADIQPDALQSTEEKCKELDGKLFIKITDENINAIKNHFRASHKLGLSINPKMNCLELQIDDKEPILFAHLDPTKNPYKILLFAFKHSYKHITRAILKKNGIDVKGKSLVSQTFSDNGPVKALNPLMLIIDSDSIMFIPQKNVTPSELSQLKKNLNI